MTEILGPAEIIIQSILSYTDHLFHGRPGLVTSDTSMKIGVKWEPVTSTKEGEQIIIHRLIKRGMKNDRAKVGILHNETNEVLDGTRVVGRYQSAGLFPEVAVWMYRQVSEVWKLNNEFAARWASYAFAQEHRDLKVVLAAFMLVQSRKGDPVREGNKIIFHDDDYRDVGEAMVLINSRDVPKIAKPPKTFVTGHSSTKNKKEASPDMDVKMILRIHDLLTMPEIVAINRELGFTRSARNPQYGRWYKTIQKWLSYREENPRILKGLVDAGFGEKVRKLVRRSGFKPESSKFFEILHWKQIQSKDGKRTIAIGQDWAARETWEGQSEEQICKRIVNTKPAWKVICGRVPASVGITPAIMSAAVEAECLSSKELIIATPTLEDLGLLKIQEIKERWERATREADDMRAANIAQRVRSKETREVLQEAADIALQKAVEDVTRNLCTYFFVDVSGSMENAIEQAKQQIARFVQAFPSDRLHVAIFNTHGHEIMIKHASAIGVETAFKGIKAGGGTDYGAGIRALQYIKPAVNESVLFFFVGDEEAGLFTPAVQASGLKPEAFAFLHVKTPNNTYTAVRGTAAQLGIPCIMVDGKTFEGDPYAIPRTLRALIASTPVTVGLTQTSRVTLIEEISKTELLKKPAWV